VIWRPEGGFGMVSGKTIPPTPWRLHVVSPKGEALLCAPQGGFWTDDFSKKNLPWVPCLDYIMSHGGGEARRRND